MIDLSVLYCGRWGLGLVIGMDLATVREVMALGWAQ